MMRYLLSTVIQQAFEDEVGKDKKEMAFLVSFKLTLNHEAHEEGYRFMDLLLYAPNNYVQVWVRERWDLEEGDTVPHKNEMKWALASHHDSVWREAISQILWQYERQIMVFSRRNLGRWYEIVPIFNFQDLDLKRQYEGPLRRV